MLAFERGPADGDGRLVTVATRRPMTLARARGWRDTSLTLPVGAPGVPGDPDWTDVLTGRTVPAGSVRLEALLSRYPVALLVRGEQ